jgi:predicted DsbA family dithiol-disulfide isomerase
LDTYSVSGAAKAKSKVSIALRAQEADVVGCPTAVPAAGLGVEGLAHGDDFLGRALEAAGEDRI